MVGFAVQVALRPQGEHAEADEVVAEDDGDEKDEHDEDGMEGLAGYGVGDCESEV